MTYSEMLQMGVLAVTVIMAGITGTYSLLDAAICPDHKRPLRLFMSATCYYYVLIYFTGLSTGNYDSLRSGTLSLVGEAMLLMLMAVSIKFDRRRKRAH